MDDYQSAQAHLVRAFEKLYDERCMKGISAAAVAKEAGYSSSSFYRVFDSVYDVLEILEARAMSQAPL